MTYVFILKCALKLVEEIILYYDARSKKHQITEIFSFIFFIFIRVDELCLFLIINSIVHRTNFNTVSCISCRIIHYVGLL